MNNIKCTEFLDALEIISDCFKETIINAGENVLNHSFAKHKMTIAQMAVHTMSWPRYFLSAEKPWQLDKFTCRPCSYPISEKFIFEIIDDGKSAIKEYLCSVTDSELIITTDGAIGKGYLIHRLLIHIMTHAEQIAFLRSMLDKKWNFDNQFGRMATALISLSNYSEKDPMFGER